MTQYEVETIMGFFYIVADKYSISADGLRILFWIGRRIVTSFLVDEVVGGAEGVHVKKTP